MINEYLKLMKPHVIWLLVLSALVGYIAAAGPLVNPIKLIELTVVGFLSTGGSAAFNMYYERDIDSLMVRTMKRPIPSGKVTPLNALTFSIAVSLSGFTLSYLWLGSWVTLMIALGWFFYAVLYTIMLKRRTWLNIVIGGFAGNAALLSGWIMAKPIDLESILLSMVIYVWIPAHIWSLAYYARDDYKRVNVPMLPTMVNEKASVRIISILNLVSIIYMLVLYQLYMAKLIGYILVIPATLAGIIVTIKALIKPSNESFRTMFKATSPILLLFLLAVIISRI
uniref:Protoheme IX farnesyltransferase n=1 Tax=Caldivirga maquilingensis (strain ATCC 700844 / DSM 13496 / JCM 10307 / IC-167) TaxID=397948 RepID=COXX_CALMQ|nr:RecName: Full=Protoheme IX farnesyltransferase; AltName: Full=Heme B farnesyltransferase; AltName: Full=Heme O synthase [Caldivirga maquilingensis IC-167]